MRRTRWAGSSSPRLIVLGALIVNFAWALVIPWSLTRPPSALLTAAFAGGLVVFGMALVLVLRSAVSPAPSPGTRPRLVGLLSIVSLALWLPSFAWAETGQEPWSWLAGCAIGASALVTLRAGVVVAIVLGVAAMAGGVVFGGSVPANVLITLGCAAVVWLMGQVPVWLLRLLWVAKAGREAEAELAIAKERLRVSRELHDVLSHRLGIIALKAELAAGLAAGEPARSAAESDEIRKIAAATLAEARQAVQGETVAGLSPQLASAGLVLASAGIETTIDADAGDIARMPDSMSRLLAAVVRESVTNVLRHSDARTVSITFAGTPPYPTLMVVNDGVRRDRDAAQGDPVGGTGLASLAARCAAAGARLVAGPVADGRFEVRVEYPPGRIPPR
ncbi:histidine kinase [Nonomuraea sp. NPDC050691]|uniref:sensor histidine kinase n=1 Tax=Nonomuraea sp. NPDC050691 TaxID=3155661 RepID=UPI0033D736C9